MSDAKFSHLVEFDETARLLKIYRIFSDGRQQLFTETSLPALAGGPKSSEYAEVARLLGENILLDSPVARRMLGT